MNVKLDSITKDLKEAIKTPTEKTKPYDTTAEVLRVEDDIVWVHIAGGVNETPVKKTINAKKGDTVQVRVSGGNAWLTGNATAPPTDDYTANIANRNAKKAQLRADSASEMANKAQASADGKNTIYYDATQPIATEGGFKIGDTWFNSAEDNAIYRYNGNAWIKEEIGEDAIAELSIKTAHIQEGAITNAKVGNLDAGKITTGTLSTNVLNVAEIISTGNIATDSEVASAKSDAEKVATNYLSYDATNGVIVGYSGLSSKVQIKGSGLYLYDGSGNIGTSIEASKTRVGRSAVGYVDIQSTGIDMYAGSSNVNLAHIGYASGNAESGTAVAPYYTFGTRESGSAIGNYSFSAGYNNKASGFRSIALGDGCTASDHGSIAIGTVAQATGSGSIALGMGTVAKGQAQTAIGMNNIVHDDQGLPTDIAFVIGNGGSQGSISLRSDALTVDWSGNLMVAGKATINGSAGLTLSNSSATTGLLKITQNGRTLTIGSGNSSFYHIYGDNSTYPIAFNTGIAMVGNYDIGTEAYPTGHIRLANTKSIYGKSSGNQWWSLVWTNTSNQCGYGYGSYVNSSGTTFYDGNLVYIRSKGAIYIQSPTGIYPNHDIVIPNAKSYRSQNSSGTVVTMLYMSSGNVITLGNSSYGTQLYGSTVKSTPMVTSSDIRLKTNITGLDSKSDKILLGLDTFNFNFKKEAEENDGRLHYGISAQQLKKLLEKEDIDTSKAHIVQEFGDYLQVSYTELIPMLIHLCQSQQREIEEIKEKLQ